MNKIIARAISPYLSTVEPERVSVYSLLYLLFSLNRWQSAISRIYGAMSIDQCVTKTLEILDMRVNAITSRVQPVPQVKQQVSPPIFLQEYDEAAREMSPDTIKGLQAPKDPWMPKNEVPAILQTEVYKSVTSSSDDKVSNIISSLAMGVIPPITNVYSNRVLMTLVYEVIVDAIDYSSRTTDFVKKYGVMPTRHMAEYVVYVFAYSLQKGETIDTVRDMLIKLGRSLHIELNNAFTLTFTHSRQMAHKVDWFDYDAE